MENVWGSITSAVDWAVIEQMLFTYSEDEREEQRLNKLNADLVLNPQFIPVNPRMLQRYSLLEATLFGFMSFFLANNEKFYCTNEQLATMLNTSEKTISLAIKKLSEDWLIELTYKMRSSGGKTRFIRKADITKCNVATLQNVISDFTKCNEIENKKIENKKIFKEKKNPPSVDELVEAYKQDEQLVRKMDDEWLVRERAEYKQTRKSTAYKTVAGFIQQLRVCIETVRFGEPRWDTAKRFRFALNQCMERDWKTLYWNEQIEQEYQSYKRTLTTNP